MADTEALVNGLGIFGDAEPESAADPAATSEVPDDAEEATLDDLSAELDGQVAPQDAAPAEEPDGAVPAANLTPEQIAAILAENDRFKAEKAQAEAQQVDAAFEDRWADHWDYGINWYQERKSELYRTAVAEGWSRDQFDAEVYRKVVMGVGLTDPKTGAPVKGQQAWERETAANEAAETAAYYRSKTTPSAFDQLVDKYGVEDADRNALAQFINYPPDHLEAMFKMVAGKNQRTTSTFQQAQTQAATNVRTRLSNLAAPGAPGAPRPKKPYQWKGNREETEFVASRVMGW